MHLRHVKYNPNGGPDGGDGGNGGSVYLRGNRNYWTLIHLKFKRHVRAEHGGNGGRDKCHGTNGRHEYIDVPCGTVVYNAETGKYICDVTEDGQEVLLLKGLLLSIFPRVRVFSSESAFQLLRYDKLLHLLHPHHTLSRLVFSTCQILTPLFVYHLFPLLAHEFSDNTDHVI